jgi:phage gpG-like protein
MTGAVIRVDDKQVVDALDQLLKAAGDLRPALKNIGEYETQSSKERIAREETPEGAKFAPLNPLYAKTKKGPGILRGATGGLSAIVYQLAGDDAVEIGSDQVYPVIHQFQVTSGHEFERLKATDPSTLTDLEQAGRFLCLQRLAFGGKVVGRNFGVSPREGAGFNRLKLAPTLEAVHERLAGVVIESLDCGQPLSTATIGPRRSSTSTRPTGAPRLTTKFSSGAASSS